MRIEADYPYKRAGQPFHSAQITLFLDEKTHASVFWKHAPESYGKAYSKELEELAQFKLNEAKEGDASIRIDLLRYQEPYDQAMMRMVVAKSIEKAFEKWRSQPDD